MQVYLATANVIRQDRLIQQWGGNLTRYDWYPCKGTFGDKHTEKYHVKEKAEILKKSQGMSEIVNNHQKPGEGPRKRLSQFLAGREPAYTLILGFSPER